MNSFDPKRWPPQTDTLDQLDRADRPQPGYAGTVIIDLPAGRRLVLNHCNSAEHSAAVLPVVEPTVGPVMNPLMSDPPDLISVGTVIFTDPIPSRGS